MGYLRQAHSANGETQLEASCVDVYERELDYLFATLLRLGASPRETEDLVQEVFLVMYRNWATLDLTRPIRPYLFAVAFRIVCAHRRRRRREIPYEYLDTEDPSIGPEESLQSRQSSRLLLTALDSIPLERRAVVVMHDLDGFSVMEIASRLSLSRFGIYARLRKARSELKTAVRRLVKDGAGS